MEVFELVGAASTRTRLQALAARGLTRFVGRQAEFEALRQAMERAGSGHGQVVAVMGSQGWARLAWSTSSSVPITPTTGSCSKAARSPTASHRLHLRDLFKAYFQIDDRDDAQDAREAHRKLLTLDAALGPTLPAFLTLLDVPVEDHHWQDLDPVQRRQRTLAAIKQLLLRESQVQPLLLVFENLHWIDTETQAVLDSLIDSLPTAPAAARQLPPEYQHGWGNKTYYTQLRLDPLPCEYRGTASGPAGGRPQPGAGQAALDRAHRGQPLFLEESVRALAETRVLVGERGAYRLARPLESLQVPATVHAVLAARTDRLPPEEKRLLQTAAVIGTEVPFALLQAIAELSEAEPAPLSATCRPPSSVRNQSLSRTRIHL